MDNVKAVEDAGADGIMINFAAVGYSVLEAGCRGEKSSDLRACSRFWNGI